MTMRSAARRLRPGFASLAGLVWTLAAAPAAFAAEDFDGADDPEAARTAHLEAAATRARSWSLAPAHVVVPENGPYDLALDGFNYWLFPVSFRPAAAEDLLRDAYLEIVENADARDEDDRRRIERIDESDRPNQEKTALAEAINAGIQRRRDELPAIHAQLETLRAEAAKRRLVRLDATLHTDGRVLRDLADDAIRNFFERRDDRRFYTAVELAGQDLNELTDLMAAMDALSIRDMDEMFRHPARLVLPILLAGGSGDEGEDGDGPPADLDALKALIETHPAPGPDAYDRRSIARYAEALAGDGGLDRLRALLALVNRTPPIRKTHLEGRLRWVVDVLLVFERPRPAGRDVELRLAGLGDPAFPRFEPGALLFNQNLVIDDPSTPSGRRFYDPALQQVLRARYDVGGGETRTRFRLASVDTDWLWLWSARLAAGHVRTLQVARGENAVRTMRYVPVFFINDTARPQPLAVRRGGLFADVEWQGIALRPRFTDGAEADEYWSTLAVRQIAERVQSGDEYNEVKEFESAGLPGVDPEPDLALKADVLPPAGRPRLPAANEIIAARERRRGLLVTRSELDNIDELLSAVATRLWLFHVLDEETPADADGRPIGLFAAYRALYPARPEGMRDDEWRLRRPAEAPADVVERLILAAARAALAERGDEPDAEDARLYNHHRFAPLVDGDVLDWSALAKALLKDDGAVAKVRARLSDVVRGHLAEADGPSPAERGVVLDALNAALAATDLFDSDEFKAVKGAEALELVARGRSLDGNRLPNLSDAERIKANRLVFDEAMGAAVRPCLDRALLGRLLNTLAAERIEARLNEGYTDVFFAVTVNGGDPEEAELSLGYRRFLPPLFPPYEIPAAVRAFNPSLLGGAADAE